MRDVSAQVTGNRTVIGRPPAEPPAVPAGAYRRGVVVRHGIRAGLVAAAAMIAWLMFCGEASAAPTALSRIQSTAWTGITAVTAVIFGRGAVHGSFDALSVGFGLVALLALGAGLGAVGALVIAETIGPQAGPFGSVTVALSFALCVQILLVNVAANRLQSPDVLYRSIPPWGWFVASATYGVVLGLRLSRLARREPAW